MKRRNRFVGTHLNGTTAAQLKCSFHPKVQFIRAAVKAVSLSRFYGTYAPFMRMNGIGANEMSTFGHARGYRKLILFSKQWITLREQRRGNSGERHSPTSYLRSKLNARVDICSRIPCSQTALICRAGANGRLPFRIGHACGN